MFTYNVDRIPSAGIAVDGALPRSKVAFLLGDHLRPHGDDAHITFELQRRGTNVVVEGTIDLAYAFECGRCAETFNRPAHVPFGFVCMQGTEDAPPNAESDDLDVEGLDDEAVMPTDPDGEREIVFYEGHTLDLEPAIAEQIVLTLPTWPVCTDDCKGLCPNCGANLNNENCSCAAQVIDPRWAALGPLKAALGGTLPRS